MYTCSFTAIWQIVYWLDKNHFVFKNSVYANYRIIKTSPGPGEGVN